MPRTNEVSFWTNIQTQGHNLWELGRLFTVENHPGCLPLCLGRRAAQNHWQESFVAAWKTWVKIAALCYRVNNLNSSQTYNDRSPSDCQGPWHALSSISKSTALSGSLISRGELGHQPLLPPKGCTLGNWKQKVYAVKAIFYLWRDLT